MEDVNVIRFCLDKNSNILELKGIEILLMNEYSYNKFKKYINYDLINNYIYLSYEKKNNYLKENINELNKIYKLIKKEGMVIPNEIPLNQECLKNIENDKFYLLNACSNYKRKRKGLDKIYFFKSKNKPFIYFKNIKKIFQLIKEKNEYWKLIEYTIPKIINKRELLSLIKEEIDNNKKVNTLRNYKKFHFDKSEKFYLINENWLNNQIKKNNCEVIDQITEIKPKINNDFGIFLKNEENDLIINNLNIKKEDLFIANIFFIERINNINSNTLYFGLINNRQNIYFYLVENEKYILKILIYYENEEIMNQEIEKNIIPYGIEEYLLETGIDFTNIDYIQKLYNIELKKIGKLYNKSNLDLDKIKPQYTRNLESLQWSYYYNAVIQCLVNIGFLKDIFLNREKLVKNHIIKDYKKITNIFYRIMQYMWYWKRISDEKVEYADLLIQIQSLSGMNNIYDRLDLLIEFLLLAIHSEQNIDNKEENINYKLNNLQNEFNKKNNSFIKDLIFFELESSCDKCNNKIKFNNYILYYNISELMTYNIIINNSGNTESLLSLKQEIFCYKCENMIYSKKRFISFPKILNFFLKPSINSLFFHLNG